MLGPQLNTPYASALIRPKKGRHLKAERIADQAEKIGRGKANIACVQEQPRHHGRCADECRQAVDDQHKLPVPMQIIMV